MEERNHYCSKASQLELQNQKFGKELENLKIEVNDTQKQNSKFLNEKSTLQDQLIKEKENLIKLQGEYSML